MKSFVSEFKSLHPELFEEKPISHKVYARQPLWLLPLLLLFGIGLLANNNIGHFLHDQRWAAKDQVAMMESEIEILKKQAALNEDLVVLTMIAHNENSAILRQHLGLHSLMFFEKDRSIVKMPRHLAMTPEDVKRIKEKYLKK